VSGSTTTNKRKFPGIRPSKRLYHDKQAKGIMRFVITGRFSFQLKLLQQLSIACKNLYYILNKKADHVLQRSAYIKFTLSLRSHPYKDVKLLVRLQIHPLADNFLK